jgi:hypothetical protein
MLRRSAHDYLRQLMAAQIIGAIIPELSEPLRDLMTKTAHERAITRLSRRRLASVRATVHDTSYRQDHVTLRTPRPPDNQAE